MKKEEFLNNIEYYSNIIIYGAQKCATATLIYLKALGIEKNIYIAVTKIIRNPSQILDKKVCCIDEYDSIKEDSLILIAVRKYETDIISVLQQKEFKNYMCMDYSLLRDDEINYISVIGEKNKDSLSTMLKNSNVTDLEFSFWLASQNIIDFNLDVQIVGHCNLNCQGCDVFAPLVKEEFLDITVFEKDLNHLSKILNEDDLKRLTLIGGEPLLHPYLKEFILLTRKYFPKIELAIFTNGINLLQMDDEFFDICKTHDVNIVFTRYPIDVDYDKIEQLLIQKDVLFMVFNGHTEIKTSHKALHQINGESDKNEKFSKCVRAIKDAELKKGRIYPCSLSASFYRLKEYFDLDMKLTEDDGVDIYECESYTDILNKLMKPIQACRYCGDCNKREGIEWKTSSRKIEEWT